MNTTVRCFRRKRDDGKRCGMWIMTEESRGAFFHGDRCEVQPPRPNISELATGQTMWGPVTEITPEEALAELDNGWPEAKGYMQKIFDRHQRIQAGEGGCMDPVDD